MVYRLIIDVAFSPITSLQGGSFWAAQKKHTSTFYSSHHRNYFPAIENHATLETLSPHNEAIIITCIDP